MISSLGPTSQDSQDWELNAVNGREAAKPVLIPTTVVYAILNTSNMVSPDWASIKPSIKKWFDRRGRRQRGMC